MRRTPATIHVPFALLGLALAVPGIASPGAVATDSASASVDPRGEPHAVVVSDLASFTVTVLEHPPVQERGLDGSGTTLLVQAYAESLAPIVVVGATASARASATETVPTVDWDVFLARPTGECIRSHRTTIAISIRECLEGGGA